MIVVGLVSGGKDSIFALQHCKAQGHQIRCLATLHAAAGIDELDSYMYQTVGSYLLPFIAEAMEVPLVSRQIMGTSLETGLAYSPVQGDETEDLYALLSDIKRRFPEVQGLSSGAILSNYQRTRVESVCARLGLISICPLWQRDQEELLDEMIDSGLHAILIKTASYGLTAQYLQKSLQEMRDHLHHLNTQLDSHICGEGGEYETIVLDSPLFSRRIVLDETLIISPDASTSFLRIRAAHLVGKSNQEESAPTIPPLLERRYHCLLSSEEIPGMSNDLKTFRQFMHFDP